MTSSGQRMDLIRVISGQKTKYAPVEPIKTASGGVLMFSEEGPHLPGERWTVPSAQEVLLSARHSLADGALRFGPGLLHFGNADGYYNEFADVTLCSGQHAGLRLAPYDPSDGDIVMSVFPSGKILPSRFLREGKRSFVELPWHAPANERCFVLDETGARLATVSLAPTAADRIRLLPRAAIVSWAAAVCPDALPEEFQSYSVEEAPERCFVIMHGGRRYKGHLSRGCPEEIEEIRETLKRHGISGVIPYYQLTKG